jgi:hypothetical protein
MRIGLVQTLGIGDIIIALPIADYFLQRGDEVHWPIDERFVTMFKPVKPEVNFIPVPRDKKGFYYDMPVARLSELRCDRIITLYSYMQHAVVFNERLSNSLKFDEYKYAIAGVPFAKKWDLRIERDMKREANLKQRLNITRPYICIHGEGSDFAIKINVPPEWQDRYQVIEISAITDSPFDWITTLEQASKLVLIDSCFSNLVDQLNLNVEKHLILRSPIAFTPVLKNGWNYAWV